jgi:hypothetical protein
VDEYWDGAQWGIQSLGDRTFRSSPAAVASSSQRLDVFALGADYKMYHNWRDRSVWQGWEPLEGYNGYFTSHPSVVSWGPDRIDIFVRGFDGKLFHNGYDHGWGNWEPLGGPNGSLIRGAPVALAPTPNRLDVFVVGEDQGLYHRRWDGGAWSDYVYIGDGVRIRAADRDPEPPRLVRLPVPVP